MNLTNISLPLNRLVLDPNNYRLDYEKNLHVYKEANFLSAQEDTLKRLEKEKLGELRDSIIQNGFLEMDRIVVRKLQVKSGKELYLIIEGNRRAAAFKGLMEDYLEYGTDLPESLVKKANAINVVCLDGSEEEMAEFSAGLMGVRHVSGPKRWSGYQAARLINDRHRTGSTFLQIGALLGISDLEAERRFKNYRAFQQMKVDPDFGEEILQKHYTLLAEFIPPSRYARKWLGWHEDKEKDIYEFRNKKNLRRVYQAITSNDMKKAEITNVNKAREFIAAIESEESRTLLERGVRLEDLPTDQSNENARLKLIKDFQRLISKLSELEISDNEFDLLKETQVTLSSYIRSREEP